MEVVVTTGAVIHAKLQSKCHHQQTNTQINLQARCPYCRPAISVRALRESPLLQRRNFLSKGKKRWGLWSRCFWGLMTVLWTLSVLFEVSDSWGKLNCITLSFQQCAKCGWMFKWLGCWTCYQQVVGLNPGLPAVECNPGHVVNTHVPLSPSSIIWYQPMGGDALRLRR